MDDAIATYFRAWNEQDPDQRRRMLERSVTDDAVLVDPTGRWEGVAGLAEWIVKGVKTPVPPGKRGICGHGTYF